MVTPAIAFICILKLQGEKNANGAIPVSQLPGAVAEQFQLPAAARNPHAAAKQKHSQFLLDVLCCLKQQTIMTSQAQVSCNVCKHLSRWVFMPRSEALHKETKWCVQHWRRLLEHPSD